VSGDLVALSNADPWTDCKIASRPGWNQDPSLSKQDSIIIFCIQRISHRSYSLHLNHLLLHLHERWIENPNAPLIGREQDSTTEHRPAESHTRAPPEALEPIIRHDTFESLHSAGTLTALATRLDGVKRLSRQSRNNPSHAAIGEIRSNRLRDILLALVVLQDVVSPHAESCRAGLLKSRPCKAAVETKNTVFFPHSGDSVGSTFESLLIPRVVNQGRLHPLCGSHGDDAGDNSTHHAGSQTAEWRQGVGFWVLELLLDVVEAEEADAIFGYAADGEGRAALVESSETFLLVDIGDD
jgi:hypothetical protein